MRRSGPITLAVVAGLVLPAVSAVGGDVDDHEPRAVAVQAGTIHLVEDGRLIEGGGTILIVDGKISAVGKDVAIPAGVRVVDYGADAVIVPGFVAADSRFGSALAGPRTAEPSLRAVDNFDHYTNYYRALTGGVTSGYLAPARGRLIAGQGAVVKMAGAPDAPRVLRASTGLHGSIGAEARNTPGYWEPPVPATVDVGLGVEQRQLPRTAMGAVIALGELLELAGGKDLVEIYGPDTGPALAELIEAGATWRMGADTAGEVRALLEFFGEHKLPLAIDGASSAADLAQEIAAAGVPVIAAPDARGTDRNFGKTPDSPWPRPDAISVLVEAGVKVAIKGPLLVQGRSTIIDLLFGARLARRGGLDDAAALRGITITPAEILGVADRVGSIAAGKDADLAVLNGPPLAPGTSVLATWVDGEIAWKADENGAVVLEVDQLFVGDGRVLAPGQVLMLNGKIAEIGRRVGHPRGATVVRGAAAMPGMIDGLGHLGLEGSTKRFSTRFDLARIVEPGDYADRRVARSGVTTVNLGSRSNPGNGSPTMAYKPAGDDPAAMVIKTPAALRMEWSARIRAASGENVIKALDKAAEYKKKWEDYEKAIAAWTPPEPAAEKEEDKEEKEAEGEEEAKDDDKKKKKKKKEELPARPVTGVWEGTVTFPDEHTITLRLRLLDTDGALEGNLRSGDLEDLVQVSGRREEYAVELEGLSEIGTLRLELELGHDDEAEVDTLQGKGFARGGEVVLALKQTSKEYEVARRAELRAVKKVKPPKGKPKSPGIDPDLEPLRQAMLGHGAVIVSVARDDEILACVDAFERHGIRPVLFGATDAHKVAGRIKDRVAGVMLSQSIIATSSKTGTKERNLYAEVQNAGIPIAFYSAAREGGEEAAAELATLAAFAVSHGLSPDGALRALTADVARMLSIDHRVGLLAEGLDADVLLLDGAALDPGTTVLRAWVNGREVR